MKKFILLFFIGTAILCLFACANPLVSDKEDINISLPSWPPENSPDYPDLSRWKITVASSEEIYSFYIYPKNTSEKKEISLAFSVKRNEPFCISAKPVTVCGQNEESAYFYPAGFLYPYNTDFSGRLVEEASWDQGFLADVMCKIISSKKETGISSERLNAFLKSFNWKKAEETIESKYSEDNPWLIDTTNLLENLCYGNFKSSFFNVTGTYTYNLSTIFPNEEIKYLSPFIPENEKLSANPQIKLKKNTPTLLSDGKTKAAIICCTSAKKMSLEFIYMPIYIEDI